MQQDIGYRGSFNTTETENKVVKTINETTQAWKETTAKEIETVNQQICETDSGLFLRTVQSKNNANDAAKKPTPREINMIIKKHQARTTY